MANFGLTIPNEKAAFRFAIRDTGDAWPAVALMPGGGGDPDKTFSTVDPCDELLIEATYPTAATFNRVHFSGMDILTGLAFSVDYGAGATVTAQTVETRPGTTQNQTIRTTTSAAATVVTVIVTGISQQILTFDQFAAGLMDWTPAQNFTDDSQFRPATRYTRQRTKTSNRQRVEDNTRVMALDFWHLTDTEYLDLEYKTDEVAAGGYALVELNSAGAAERDAFLAVLSLSGYSSVGPNLKRTTLNIIEKDTA